MNKLLTRGFIPMLLALTLLGAACSPENSGNSATGTNPSVDSDEDTGNSTSETPSEDAEGEVAAVSGVDTPAATLTRDLTYLLEEHEYLAGIAVFTAVQAGGDLKDPTFMAAAGALDENTVALGEAIGSFYGDGAEKQFLSSWRKHIGFFVDYTLGAATGDKKMMAEAKKNLDGYRADFGALIEGATEGELSQEAVAEALTPHVESTLVAIDSVVAGDGKAFDKLRIAASHLPGIATALAGGISAQQGLEGEADSPAAGLQRDLTYLLEEHEYLAGIAVFTAVQAGGDLKDPTFMAAAGALDDNTIALGKAIGSVYGDAAEKQFLSSWRKHIGFFVDYTLGKATGDKKMAAEAEKNLDGYRADFGALIEGATEGGLSQDQVAEALVPHVESTLDAIDSVVAGDGKAFSKLRVAASHLPGIATALSGAISAQFPDKF